jgi:acetyl-CoA decarbonylase/synthase complex subunit beta
MAATTSGGRQVEGSCGLALELIRSPKFFQADGGLYRIAWLPQEIKERYKDVIPKDLYDKIATEKDVSNATELAAFLEKVGHPWLKGEVTLP